MQERLNKLLIEYFGLRIGRGEAKISKSVKPEQFAMKFNFGKIEFKEAL